ncbi:hypothetical protein QI633_09610 [Nocardioides sp. QY071]|nr:hypothetical protein [Nocardioides sp. QY071]WGY04009.1 hypothetical protein QI633_09610 [Nocardioides sp. QY071]
MRADDEEGGCRVRGCPWIGPPDECPFRRYDEDSGNTFIDGLMQQRPGD